MSIKLFLLVVLALVLSNSVLFARNFLDNSFFYGVDSYSNTDSLSSFFYSIFGAKLFALEGLLTVFLLYFLLKRLGVKSKFWILFVFISSPAFVGVYSSLNELSFIFILFLIEALLYYYNSFFIFFIPLLVGLSYLQFSLLNIFLLFFLIKEGRLLLKLIVINVLSFLFFNYKNIFIPELNFSFFNLIAEFANNYGVSFFAFVLALYGLVLFFRERNKQANLFFAGIFIFAFFFKGFELFFHAAISFFAGICLYYLNETEWIFSWLKRIFFALIILALLFSSLSHASYLSSLPPYKSFEFYSRVYLNSNDVVLTTNEMGVWLSDFSNTTVISDKKILQSRDFNELINFIRQRKISRIVIPSYEVGNSFKEGEGLLFFLENKEYFTKELNHNDLIIWKVVK